MTLEAALRQHLACTHTLAVASNEASVWAAHHAEDDPASVEVRRVGTDAAAGSTVFHALSNRLIQLPGHTRTPMHITDEEYAGFVA